MLTLGGADHHLLCSSAVDQRTLGGVWLRPVAQAELGLHRFTQLLHKAIVDAALNQETVGADARLQEDGTIKVSSPMPCSALLTVPPSSTLRPPQHATWPEFRNLDAMAPPTALSTSALSKTMKGAWPPSSMETFFTVSAAIFSSN